MAAQTNIFQDTVTAIRHTLGIYTDQEKADLAKLGDKLREQEKKPIVQSTIEDLTGTDVKGTLDWIVLGVFGLLIYSVLFKD
jgi:hypothetical protein